MISECGASAAQRERERETGVEPGRGHNEVTGARRVGGGQLDRNNFFFILCIGRMSFVTLLSCFIIQSCDCTRDRNATFIWPMLRNRRGASIIGCGGGSEVDSMLISLLYVFLLEDLLPARPRPSHWQRTHGARAAQAAVMAVVGSSVVTAASMRSQQQQDWEIAASGGATLHDCRPCWYAAITASKMLKELEENLSSLHSPFPFYFSRFIII